MELRDIGSFGSFTLYQRLLKNPENHDLWKEWIKRNEDRIYSWTRKWLRDPNDGDDVFMEICKKIYEIMTIDSRKPLWPKNNNYQAVLQTITRNICWDLVAKKKNCISVNDLDEIDDESWKNQAAEELFLGMNDLDDQQIKQLGRYRDLFRDALIQRKVEPQYSPRSTEIFFKIYHEGLETTRVNQEYGYTDRDTSRKQAQRELRRLVALMKLPTETAAESERSETIVAELAKVYGDLSHASDR